MIFKFFDLKAKPHAIKLYCLHGQHNNVILLFNTKQTCGSEPTEEKRWKELYIRLTQMAKYRTGIFLIYDNKKKKVSNWPQVLWGLVWCETGPVWVQWVPWSPWDQEVQGAPTALKGPLVLDLLTQTRLMWVNWRQLVTKWVRNRIHGDYWRTIKYYLDMWP